MFPAFLAVLGWFSLCLQFYLMVAGTLEKHESLTIATGRFFLYFTVLTNLQAAVVATGAGFFRRWRRPGLEAATAVFIAMVGLGYSLLLRHLFLWTGWTKLADALLHDVLPLLFVLWWIFGAEKARLAWRSVLQFLWWPLAYLVTTLMVGGATAWYPYPFVNAATLGYPRVTAVSLGLLVATAIAGSAAVAWSRIQSARVPPRAS